MSKEPLPVTPTDYPIWIDGIQITSANAADVLSGDNAGKVCYDAAKNTLTLRGAQIQGIESTSETGLTIDLVGENKVTDNRSSADRARSTIFATGLLTISGNGSLAISGTTNREVDSGFTVRAYGGIIIDGAQVSVENCSSALYAGNGLAGNMVIKNSARVTASFLNRGIQSGNNISIMNSSVILDASENGPVADFSAGIITGNGGAGTITIGGNSQVEAEGQYAILAYDGAITINGGTVTAVGTSTAIDSDTAVCITGGTVTATANDTTGNAIISETVKIGNSAKVTASSGYPALYAKGEGGVVIEGGELEITSAASNAIYADAGGISITNAEVTATGAYPAIYGNDSNKGIAIQNSTVKAKGIGAVGIYSPGPISITASNVVAEGTGNIRSGTGISLANAVITEPDDGVIQSYTNGSGQNVYSILNSQGIQANKVVISPKVGYTVTYDANGADSGTVPTDGTPYASGDSVTVLGNTGSLTKRGCTFSGWSTVPSGIGISYAANATFDISADTTLYAKWTANSSGSDRTYKVSVDYAKNGNVSADRNFVSEGSRVTLTVTPDDGYRLDSVTVVDGKGNVVELTKNADETYRFIMPKGGARVTAAFVKENTVADCDSGKDCPAYGFTDLNLSQWYHDGIHYCLERGLMTGAEDKAFAPHGTTSRGMIAAILYRLEGEPEVQGNCPFDDVEKGFYYEDAILWAESKGIVEGYGENSFGPDDAITREQMATILYRYAKFKGYDVSGTADLSGFSDAGTISAYAKTALAWANAAGLIEGAGDGTIQAGDNAERCQAAAILMRFCENTAK